ncbi:MULTISPECIES: hypothetical protein [Arcicella]|uniref:Uncharacterized protein n=1 Tax=Arcicella aquatica TaxID=217141 RepID=A0ABU5QSX1_9BACT|nr:MULTISPECIES: hypothetical protein [Arcicella]MDR6564125.1 hypothetical protein [Arcicella sp. BE51]MDR6813878.1 hypothetical protein [Arcicella sp. BE140]MDR6825190.1 hypothetical protein [Arcicella sp. BE139]MEA5260202.1 hypothetical protein [Arcicella aquatica]
MFPTVSPKKISERKRQLHLEAKAYKETIDGQVSNLKSEATRIGTRALIIGGVLATSYLLFSYLTSDNEKKVSAKISENGNLPVIVKKEKAKESWLVSSIKGYMLSFLMAIAKDKIIEALSILKENYAEKSSQ